MEVKATLINSQQGSFRRKSLLDIFEKITNKEKQYDLNISNIRTFQHGLKIEFEDREILFNDHTLELEFDHISKAELYILDNGEIYYFNLGQKGKSYDAYKGEVEEEYDYIDMSSETDKLQKRLGVEFIPNSYLASFAQIVLDPNYALGDVIGNKRSTFYEDFKRVKEDKIRRILDSINEAINNGTYMEAAYKIDPVTKQYTPIGKDDVFTSEEVINQLHKELEQSRQNQEQQGGKSL